MKRAPRLLAGPTSLVFLGAIALGLLPNTADAGTRSRPATRPPLYVSLIDQLPPQGSGPAINGLDERRRGPIFAAALQQGVREGSLPAISVINPDLSLSATVANEPRTPAGKTLVRIYLTQWSQTRLGGTADTEILCRIFVEVLQAGKVSRKLGPYFAHQTCDVTAARPEDRWAQYQGVALAAIREMAVALPRGT